MAEHPSGGIAPRNPSHHLLAGVSLAFAVLASMPYVARADPVSDGFAAYQRGDYATAYKLCIVWAQHGNRDAKFLIGLMYANGRGVRRSYADAAQWYQDAADDDQDSAENNLGELYAAGRGVRRSLVQAATLYWHAADQGNPRAQYNLAVAYRDGQGVKQDNVHAYMWYTLSAAAGWDPEVHDRAIKERDDLAKAMTPAQAAQAEADAASWKPTLTHSTWPLGPDGPGTSNAWPHPY
jgi:TPR repeat protein